jgi:hypothetical protein
MFNKGIALITLVLAIWGSALSTYIFWEQKQSQEPNLYSTYTITANSDEPAKDGAKNVRFNFYISNAGKNRIEIPASIKIQTFDSREKISGELTARLMSSRGEQLDANINDLLDVGEQRMYSTSYSEMKRLFTPHMNYLIKIRSGNDVFVSIRNPPMNPEKLEKIFNIEDGAMLKYFGNIKVSPQKMSLQQ